MRILFDQGTRVPLRRRLIGHGVATANEMTWGALGNGERLRKAEAAFDVVITTDKNMRYQQSMTGRRLAILVLPTTSWPKLLKHPSVIADAVDTLRPGDFVELNLVL